MIRAALLALILAGSAAAPGARAAEARLELDARVVWSEPDPAFGGFSGLDVGPDGLSFLAIADRGRWARGRLIRDGGRLARVEQTAAGALRAISGRPLGEGDNDAEGLALGPDGRMWVSFEGFHRIRAYADPDAPATNAPSHRDFKRLQGNSGLEALAFDEAGVLYAIPERSGALDRPFPVYRLLDGTWDKTLRLPRSGEFLVAGADFGPDGRLYLLERTFSWLGGFATRIRRFAPSPEGFDDGETLLETEAGSTDNFEGVSVWRDPSGEVRVTLIADDNFFALQSTVLAEYVLVEP